MSDCYTMDELCEKSKLHLNTCLFIGVQKTVRIKVMTQFLTEGMCALLTGH